MARGRMISKSWSTAKTRARLYREAGPLAEFCLQLFPLLVVHSDDYGRLDADPETVKLVCDPCCPRSVEDFERALEFMERVCLVVRYRVDGRIWLQIIKFDLHQSGLLSKRSHPRSPAPPAVTKLPENSADSVLTKPNLTQPKRTKNICAEASSAPSSPPFLEFPIVGLQGTSWTLSEAQVAEWAALFPGSDVGTEAKKALAWIMANPQRRKTGQGMKRFLVGWLTRAVDTGRARHSDQPPPSRAAHQPFVCPHSPPCTDGRLRCYQRQHGIGVAG